MNRIRVLAAVLSALVLTVAILAAPARAAGDVDPLDLAILPASPGTQVSAIAVQPDGKVVIAGKFTSVLGVARSNIARLNANGTLDLSFDPKANGDIYAVALQADGRILLGGAFTTLQPNGAPAPTTRNRIARLESDGSLDVTFNPNANERIYSIVVQADDRILLGGLFSTLQPNGAPSPTTRQFIARLNSTGTLDAGFDPKADTFVLGVAEQPDGKIVLVGYFTSLQPNGAPTPTTRMYVARVNSDGTLDSGFDPNASNGVYSVAVLPDGKVLLGGVFTFLQPNGAPSPTTRNGIARLNADGTLDAGFDPNATAPGGGLVETLAIQADGKVLFGGTFNAVQPNGAPSPTTRNNIARVNADGSLDASFNPNANSTLHSITVQPDGAVFVGGFFTELQPNGALSPTARARFAKLSNDAASQILTAPSASQVQWQRSGAGPELKRVALELSTDGGLNWTALGTASRIGTSSNWQRTGLTLPVTGSLRARGITSSGIFNSSSGIIEQVAPYNLSPDTDGDGLLDVWELTYFPSLASTSALDDNSDQDGVTALAEEAFGLNPTAPDLSALPQVVLEGGYLTITVTKHAGVTYEVQSAGTLETGQPDSFSAATTTVLTDNPTTLKVRDNFLTSAAAARYMRVKVTAAP